MSELPPCPKCQCEYTYESGALLTCPECAHEWNPAETQEDSYAAAAVRDSAGNVLADGDCVVLIKDLKLGGTQVLKGGSKSKPIKLVDGDHEISCRVDGIAVGLKAQFVKKA